MVSYAFIQDVWGQDLSAVNNKDPLCTLVKQEQFADDIMQTYLSDKAQAPPTKPARFLKKRLNKQSQSPKDGNKPGEVAGYMPAALEFAYDYDSFYADDNIQDTEVHEDEEELAAPVGAEGHRAVGDEIYKDVILERFADLDGMPLQSDQPLPRSHAQHHPRRQAMNDVHPCWDLALYAISGFVLIVLLELVLQLGLALK